MLILAPQLKLRGSPQRSNIILKELAGSITNIDTDRFDKIREGNAHWTCECEEDSMENPAHWHNAPESQKIATNYLENTELAE